MALSILKDYQSTFVCFMSMHIINLLPLITFKIHNDP